MNCHLMLRPGTLSYQQCIARKDDNKKLLALISELHYTTTFSTFATHSFPRRSKFSKVHPDAKTLASGPLSPLYFLMHWDFKKLSFSIQKAFIRRKGNKGREKGKEPPGNWHLLCLSDIPV